MNSCVQVGLSTWMFLCMFIGVIATELAVILWKLQQLAKANGSIRGARIDGSGGSGQ